MAAAISFYLLFSFFPFLIFLLSTLSLFLQETNLREQILNSVVRFLPLPGDPNQNILVLAIRDISNISTGTLGVLGFIGVFWSSSSVFGVVRTSLNTIYKTKSKLDYVFQKLIDFFMVVTIGILFMLSIMSTILMHGLRNFRQSYVLLKNFPVLHALVGDEGLLIPLVSLGIPYVISITAFFLIYWIEPARRFPFKHILCGAIFASILFEIGKVGFIFYVQNFSKYDLIFGSLGSVIFFLLWVYVSAIIFLLGAELIYEYTRLKSGPNQ
jgi:membrane protein